MPDNIPGFEAIKETEENQLWASGPDNNHKRFTVKAHIKSTVTDSGNTPTTTLRGGNVIARKDSDGLDYLYSAAANDGTQNPIGLLQKHTSMLRDGTATDRFTQVLTQGIIRNIDELIGSDKFVRAVCHRLGLHLAQATPDGSAFGLAMRGRRFHTADYTILDADHGMWLIAITNAVNFTLPSLATVGRGFQVLLYNAVDANMVITGAANTIVSGDAGGALSTTITFSTANAKMGGHALMVSEYGTDGATLHWYPLFVGRTPTTA